MSKANVDFVRSIYERWEAGDYSAVDWADPEIEFSVPGVINPKVQHGVEEMGRVWPEWLQQFEGFESHAVEYLDKDDQVLVLTRFSGRGRTSRVPIEDMPGAARFVIRDGKVVELAIYTDVELARREAGVEP